MNGTKTFIVVAIITLFHTSLVLCQDSNDLLKLKADDSINVEPVEIDENSQSFRLFNLIWSPIKAGMRKLKSLFASEEMQERMSKAREKAFALFLQMYKKQYPAEEIPQRLKIFTDRMKMIEESAKKFREGLESFVLRPNKFADWKEEELQTLSKTNIPKEEELSEDEKIGEAEPRKTLGSSRLAGSNSDDGLILKAEIPKSKDWRTSGCVATPIDQGKCGSCYAVATMGAIEATRCIMTGSAAILSPQYVVDCASGSRYNAQGCNGGWPTSVFRFLQDRRVAFRERCYPYQSKEQYCRARSLTSQSYCPVGPGSKDSYPSSVNFKVLNNEADILYHVANTGPVVTAVQTTQKLLLYGSGIFSDSSCRGGRNSVDHAFLIVGYGTSDNIPYWIIKNSWGTDWGENGYVRMRRGYTCSVGRWGWVMTG